MGWEAIGGLVGALAAGIAEFKRRREKARRLEAERKARQAEKDAADLQRILDLAHEMEKTEHLVDQARRARERAKVR